MPLNREQKQKLIDEMKAELKDATTVVFVNFHGLKVGDVTAMRRTLREQGVKYKVARKTLVHKALAGMGFEGEMPEMERELAIAFGSDVMAPARETYGFQKKHKEQLKILGGIFEGRFRGGADMTEIANIPSRETLIAQVLNIINSPIQRLAIAVEQIAKVRES